MRYVAERKRLASYKQAYKSLNKVPMKVPPPPSRRQQADDLKLGRHLTEAQYLYNFNC